MTTLREAAQQALEALEAALSDDQPYIDRCKQSITALRAALAEPVEPVAWQWLDTAHFRKKIPADATPAHWRPLYTAPPQRKPLTEEEIRDLWSWAMTAEAERTATTQQHAFARAIERAHGIV